MDTLLAKIEASVHSGHHSGHNHVKNPMIKEKKSDFLLELWGGSDE